MPYYITEIYTDILIWVFFIISNKDPKWMMSIFSSSKDLKWMSISGAIFSSNKGHAGIKGIVTRYKKLKIATLGDMHLRTSF